MSQLPIVLSAPNAAKATYAPRTKNVPYPTRKMTDQYFLGWVTIRSMTINKPNTAVLKEYQRHCHARLGMVISVPCSSGLLCILCTGDQVH